MLAYEIDSCRAAREVPSFAEAAPWIMHTVASPTSRILLVGAERRPLPRRADLAGIEVMNGGSERLQGNGLSAVHWNEILQRGARASASDDDSHYAGQAAARVDDGAGAERSWEAVLEALRSGSFYSSTGAKIHGVEVDGDGDVDGRSRPRMR